MNRPEEFDPQTAWQEVGESAGSSREELPFSVSAVEAGLAAAFGRVQTPPQRNATGVLYEAGIVIADKYRLIECIGEGGMGTVWYAEQSSPVKRKVAVKLIKPGLDSKSVLARFDAERQALALMDHPNIAKVFDGGITNLGHPFFVMELVRGTSITTWCDENRIGLRERLELLMPVCQAIHHAHQKGVIHRDIKPSNIMVALFDGKPIPKVIDFGVAKAFGATLTEMSLHTDFGAVVGTAEYMSPEQAELNNLDIDTRSDVYSLGVLMYELLAGSPPFSRGELADRGWHEILRTIREVDPQRPSVKLSTSKMRANIAAMRGIEPAALGKLLKSELDWIVMKSLEKERSRRYESASAMAGDLQRYLNDETVEACPPSTAYRIRKVARRNRWQVVATGLLVASLIAGMIGTAAGMWRAESQREIAEQARRYADERAEGERLAKLEAQRQQKLAEEAEDATLESFRASTDDAMEKLIISKTELTSQERAYLENALRRWQEFADRKGNDPRSRAIRAEAHFRVGSIWESLGDLIRTKEEYESACAMMDRLAQEIPEGKYRFLSARYRRNLASTLRIGGKHREAESQIRKSIDDAGKLVVDLPDEPQFLQELIRGYQAHGRILTQTGNLDEAESSLRKAVKMQLDLVHRYPEVAEFRPSLAFGFLQAADLISDLGRGDAKEYFKQSLERFERLVADDSTVLLHRAGLADCLNRFGRFLAKEGDVTKAEEMLRGGLKIRRILAEEYPSAPNYREELANSHQDLGWFLRDRKSDTAAAESEYRAALAIRERLATEFPARDYRASLANSHFTLGFILSVQAKSDSARSEFLRALEIRKQLAAEPTAIPSRFIDLGWCYYQLGQLELEAGNDEEALEWFDKAVEKGAPLFQSSPEVVIFRTFLQYSYQGRAKAKRQLELDDQSDWNESLRLLPDDGRPHSKLHRVSVLLEAHRYEAALPELEALPSLEDNSGKPVWNQVDWYDLAREFAATSPHIENRQQELEDRAMELLTKAIDQGFSEIDFIDRDKTLDPIRNRPEFVRLMERMKSLANKKD